MNSKTWSYVKNAKPEEMVEMLATVNEENAFQRQEPHGEDGQPIVFKLERHSHCYQMQAYTPSGEMMDNSYHESFIRCNNCGHIATWYDEDDGIYCVECKETLQPWL